MRGRQARNFTTNVPKILVLKSSSEQISSRKLPLGAPELSLRSRRLEVMAAIRVREGDESTRGERELPLPSGAPFFFCVQTFCKRVPGSLRLTSLKQQYSY